MGCPVGYNSAPAFSRDRGLGLPPHISPGFPKPSLQRNPCHQGYNLGLRSQEAQIFASHDKIRRKSLLLFLPFLSVNRDPTEQDAAGSTQKTNVFHRDLKPKNVLANADCILKICDFGLARVAFNDTPTAIFWTDYVATRWYRAPELCGSFFSKYTPAIDIWSIGCIFSEILTGKPLFPGKNVVHQLDLITDLLGTPSPEAIAKVRNEKTRRYLSSMRKKKPMPFSRKFPNADPLALRLLERLLAFEPNDRPTAEEALADPYFKGLANVEREPSARTISKIEFEFERRRVTKEDVRELIYREILEYHPQMLKEYIEGADSINFMYPSAVDQFKKQFAHLEEHYGKGGIVAPLERQHASLPRTTVLYSNREAPLPEQTYSCSFWNPALEAHDKASRFIRETEQHQQDRRTSGNTRKVPLQVPQKMLQGGSAKPGKVIGSVIPYENCSIAEGCESRMFTIISSQYDASIYSNPWWSSDAKVQQDEKKEVAVGSNLMQSTQYAGTGARKVAASHSGMARWL